MNPAGAADADRRPVLRGVAIGAACLLLTLVFAALQFPWDRLSPWLIGQIERATGVRMEIGQLGPSWSLTGPAARVDNLVLHLPGRTPLLIDWLRARPALSLSWLAGEPALGLVVGLAGGEVAGTLWPAGESGFDGDFHDVDTTRLPEAMRADDLPLEGLLSGAADLRQRGGRWAGELEVTGTDGSLLLPNLPIALPFDQVHAEVQLDEAGLLTLEGGTLDGPLASFEAEGTVTLDGAGRPEALDLQVTMRDVDPSLRGMLANQGFRLNADGGADLAIRGSARAPQIEVR